MTKTDWTTEEVRAIGAWCQENSSGTYRNSAIAAHMLAHLAERIEADERAVTVAWLVVDAKGKRFTIYNPRLAEAIKQVAEQSGSTLKVSAVCEMPLEGWYCTRGADHEGPCAAWPNHPPAQPAQVENPDDLNGDPSGEDASKLIRAELLAMDAEIERLNAGCKQHLRQAMENGRDATRAESRLAAADALLRELGEWDLMNIPTATAIQLDRKIETYLQSEPRP